MLFIPMSSLSLRGGVEICSWLKKMVCFLECCSSVEMSSQNINVWRPNPSLTEFVGRYSEEFYKAEFSYTGFLK